MNQLRVKDMRWLGIRAMLASLLVLVVTGCTTTAADGTESAGMMGLSWWAWALVGLILLGLLWWLMSRNRKSGAMTEAEKKRAAAAAPPTKTAPPVAPTTPAAPAAPAAPVAAAATVAAPAPPIPDDLTKIEGIGPKINTVLHAAGITTYAGLSKASQDQLESILAAAHLTGYFGDPTTWPAQAELAAAGKWEELESMQASLKGGRVE